MRIYNQSEARRQFAAVLEQASREGAVRVRCRDGRMYLIRPEPTEGSPLAVDGVDTDITDEQINEAVREGRQRHG